MRYYANNANFLCRSELMELYRVIIPKDDAWKVVEALGNIDSAHFVDLNQDEQPFGLPYATRIKLCEAAEKRIEYLLTICMEYKIKIHKPANQEVFARKIEQMTHE